MCRLAEALGDSSEEEVRRAREWTGQVGPTALLSVAIAAGGAAAATTGKGGVAVTFAMNGLTRIEPASLALLGDPVEFFFSEHFRQRQVFSSLAELAAAEKVDRALAVEILAFLVHDMALHYWDEEEGLFPLMRQKCPPEDEIDDVLAALSVERGDDHHLAELVIAGLKSALGKSRSTAVEPFLREVMLEFVLKERRHLALENSVVLPLARLRLKPRDLAELSARMMLLHGAASL